MSEVLSQEDIDQLLEAIGPNENDFKSVCDCRKIRIYDFKRPDKFSKTQLRDISRAFELIANSIKCFLAGNYDIQANIHVASVDQITFEEFIRSLPNPSPAVSFEWLESYGILQMDPALFFEGFLGAKIKKNRDLNGFESKIFLEQIYKPLEEIIASQIEKDAGTEFEPVKNQEFKNDICLSLKNKNPLDMVVLVSLVMKIGKSEGMVNVCFSGEVIEKLNETKFFSCLGLSNIVPLSLPEPDTFVELGRFRLEENQKIEAKKIYELNKLAGELLDIYKDGKLVSQGECVLIDDNYGVRVTSTSEEADAPKYNDFYNTKVVLGGCNTEDDEKFEEGRLLELNEYGGELSKIIKDGKVIAYGELVVIDESFGIKVKKVCS